MILAAVLMIAAAGLVYFLTRNDEVLTDQKYYSQLTGNEVSEEESKRPILGIMIENSNAARPQSGLDSAGIVFETVSEGGVTRYLALYQENQPDEIGPVRSLRPYFLDWSMGFDASIAHVGGSAEALELAEKRDAKSLNQFQYSDPYYRTEDRQPPHNMYVKTDGLRKLQKELQHSTSVFDNIPREDEKSSAENQQNSSTETDDRPDPGEEGAEIIKINFSGPDFLAEFRYNMESKNYSRYLAGEPHIDRLTNQPITVKNLVILQTASEDSRNGNSKALGEGRALIFREGVVVEAKWRLDEFDERVKILGNDNEQIPLSKGDIWFAVLSEDKTVDY